MSGSAESASIVPKSKPVPGEKTFAISPYHTQTFNFNAPREGHLRFIRLDNDVVSMKETVTPGVFDQVGNIGNIPWSNNPKLLTTTNLKNDPGRFTTDILPLVGDKSAIPTHHFGSKWMQQKAILTPPKTAIDKTNVLLPGTPLEPGVICTGPFVCDLKPDPGGNACMRLLITVEYEAGVEYTESTYYTGMNYINANNGAVFLANPDQPWSITEISPLTLVMKSSAGDNENSSDRYVYINRGLLSVVYTGDVEGIVKNVSVNVSGNTTNQFGYGSIGLGAERVFTKIWDSAVNSEPPGTATPPVLPGYTTAPSTTVISQPVNVNEFLRLEMLTGFKIYATSPLLNLTDPIGGGWVATTSLLNPYQFTSLDVVYKTSPGPTFGDVFSVNFNDLDPSITFPFVEGTKGEITLYLAKETTITAAALFTDVDPIFVLTISYDNTILPRLVVKHRIGNSWINKNSGVPRFNTKPVLLEFTNTEGIEIPDFTGIFPLSSETSTDFICSFPLGKYGSTYQRFGSEIFLGNTPAGVKRIGYNFNNTTRSHPSINFVILPTDILQFSQSVTPNLLFWDPIFDTFDVPDIITISNPIGYKLVRVSGVTRINDDPTQAITSFVYKRLLRQNTTIFDKSIYSDSLGPGAKSVVTESDSVDITQTLLDNFITSNTTNDSFMWSGSNLNPGSKASDQKYALGGNPVEFGRKLYRYARYIEMAAHGKKPSEFTVDEFGTNLGIIKSRIESAATRLWSAARRVLKEGVVPKYEVLRRLNAVASGSVLQGDVTNFTGLDVYYGGKNRTDKLSLYSYTIGQFLTLHNIINGSQAAARILALYPVPIAFPIPTQLEHFSTFTAAQIQAIVNADAANGAVPAAEKLTLSVLTDIVAKSVLAVSNYRFTNELARFNKLRYDRAMTDISADVRPFLGGLTNRFSYEIDRWAVQTNSLGVPITSAAQPIPTSATSAIYVTQLKNLIGVDVPPATISSDPRIIKDGFDNSFGFYSNHNVGYGYIIYAAYIAHKYAKDLTDPQGVYLNVGSDITDFLDIFTNAPAGDEVAPLLQIILDIASPPSGGILEGNVSADNIRRVYPPHRHFDPYTGSSWSPGPAPGYEGLNNEACSENILAYLATYRFMKEYADNGFNPFLLNSVTRFENNTYFPVTAYTILSMETAYIQANRPTRYLPSLSDYAKNNTYVDGGDVLSIVGKGGYPVTGFDGVTRGLMQNFVSSRTNIGVARKIAHTFNQRIYRNFPVNFIQHPGAQLIPNTDLSPYINTFRLTSILSKSVDDNRFGNILTLDGIDIITIGKWINFLICDSPNDTDGLLVDPATAGASTPSREVQQWARMVASMLKFKVQQSAFPATNPVTTAIPFPKGPGYYLPQSSWYDTLMYYRINSVPEPLPDTSNPYGIAVAPNIPTPGNSGIITTSLITPTSITLTWTLGTSPIVEPLFYKIYYSTSDNIDTADVGLIETNGTYFPPFLIDTATVNVINLTPFTDYWFNIVISNIDGVKVAYTAVMDTTLQIPFPFERWTNDNLASTPVDVTPPIDTYPGILTSWHSAVNGVSNVTPLVINQGVGVPTPTPYVAPFFTTIWVGM